MRQIAVSNKEGVTPHGGAPVVVQGIPFTAAAHQHQEPAFKTPAKILTTATQQLDPIQVPSFGYLRHLFLDVNTTTVGVGGTLHEDGPWSIIQSLTLLDVNGAPIIGPIDGFGLYLANLVGGYAFQNDPALWPGFSAVVTAPRFQLRVPLEIAAHNALGSIANQNAAAPYQLQITLNQISGVYSVAPGTAPTITISGTLETWTLPASVDDESGAPQNQLPPAHGTGQFWSSRNQAGLAVGDNTIPVNRVGSLLRNIVFVCRNATPVRADNVFPDPIIVNWDGRQLVNESQLYRVADNYQKLGKRLTGVFVYPFDATNNGKVGDESPNLWLPTQQSTRLEVNGNVAAAGSVQVIINDVQPIEVQPDQRYVEDNATAPALQGEPVARVGA